MKEVFPAIKLAVSEKSWLGEIGKEFMEMVSSYYKDAIHFYQKGEYLESFECLVYAWGWLDAGARVGIFEISKNVRRHFKIDQ